MSQFLRLAVQQMVQEMLEQEVVDYLGRERYERREEAQQGTTMAMNRDGFEVPKAR